MANGKVVIETILETKKFDKQIDEVDKQVQELERKLSEEKSINADTTQIEAQLERLKNKFADLSNKSFQAGLSQIKNIEFNPQTISNLNNAKVQLEGIDGNIKNIKGNLEWVATDMKDLKSGWDGVNDKTNNSNRTLLKYNKNINKTANKMKRLALSMLSVGSIFAAVSKASSAYLSQNEEIANKLQSVWVGLGSFLSPIIEKISDVLLKGLGYLNEFVKALTGTDYIANANARALEKQAKSQKQLNKEVQNYDFDVIRKQQDTTSSSNGIDTSGLIKIPELNNGIVKKLQDMATWLKENQSLVKNLGIVLGTVFGTVAIGKIVGNIATLIGSASAGGIVGITTAVGLLAASLATLAGIDIAKTVKAYKELKEMEKNNYEMQVDNYNRAEKVRDLIQELLEKEELIGQKRDATVFSYEEESKLLINQLDNLKSKGIFIYKYNENAQLIVKRIKKMIDGYDVLYQRGVLTNDETKKYKKTLEDSLKVMENLGIDTSDIETKLKRINADEFKIKIKTIVDTKEGKEKIKNLFDFIENKTNKIPILGTLIKSVTSQQRKALGFAHGGIVTQPTQTLIGEAGYNEYVLPEREDYLSRLASLIGQYSNNGGSPVNVYLDGRLIQREIEKTKERINFATNK
jgi:hypothetical protein